MLGSLLAMFNYFWVGTTFFCYIYTVPSRAEL